MEIEKTVNTFSELFSIIKDYERTNFCQLYIRDRKTFESIKKTKTGLLRLTMP